MALQSSGQIGAGNIRTEFNQTGEVSISDYYRNGGLVDADQTSVPLSGEISFTDFYGIDEPSSGTTGPFYDSNYSFSVEQIDAGEYEVIVKWNGVVVINTSVFDSISPSSITGGTDGYTYTKGALQTGFLHAVSRTVS